MTPIFNAALLFASLLPPQNFDSRAASLFEPLRTLHGAKPELRVSGDDQRRPVIYFDAPPRPYEAVIRR